MTVHSPPAAADLPEWRLDDLFAGRDDPRIEQDLEAARQANADLTELKGRLVASRSDPQRLGKSVV